MMVKVYNRCEFCAPPGSSAVGICTGECQRRGGVQPPSDFAALHAKLDRVMLNLDILRLEARNTGFVQWAVFLGFGVLLVAVLTWRG